MSVKFLTDKDEKNFVKTVNGKSPDVNGNVVVQGGGGGTGESGADGFSPIANVTQTDSGAVISVTDKNGTTTATITNGKDGVDGQPGKDGYTPVKGKDYFDGEDGQDGSPGKDGVSATHSWNGTTLTITSASGTSSANLKGEKGDKGDKGDSVKGDKGDTGAAGISVSSVKQTTTSSADGGSNVVTVTLSNGTTSTFTVKNGSKGSSGTNGTNGKDGTNGTSVTVSSVTESTEDGGTNIVKFSDGKTVNIKNGSKGDKGDTGGDYIFTEADRTSIIAEVQATANQQTPLFANTVAECTDTTKVYVLPDGYIYGYIKKLPTVTYETHSNKQWNDAGVLVSADGIQAKNTNVIPVSEGDQFIYTGNGKWAVSVLWLKSNNVRDVLSYERYGATTAPATATVTAPAGAKYVMFASWEYNNPGVTLEVTPLSASYKIANTGHAFVPADYEDRITALESSIGETASVLKGKKIVYDGDSICESRTGSSANNGGGYAKLIADRVGGTYVNQAVGGARLTTKGSNTYHSVVDNLPNLPKDADLYCFEGGINDYWTPKALGTFSKTDFTGTLDTNTICGALETIFRYALTNFVGKPICFVIAHKIQSTAYTKNSNGDTFEDYRDAMVGICNKYSISYYDAFSESGLNGWNTAQNNAYLTSNSSGTADGCHPNAEGYKRYYVPQLIQLFERIMPI